MQNFTTDCSSGIARPRATAKTVGKHDGQKVEGSFAELDKAVDMVAYYNFTT